MPARFCLIPQWVIPTSPYCSPEADEIASRALEMCVPPEVLTWTTHVAVVDSARGRDYIEWYNNRSHTCWDYLFPTHQSPAPLAVSHHLMDQLFGTGSAQRSQSQLVCLGRPHEHHILRAWQSAELPPPVPYTCTVNCAPRQSWPFRRQR